MFEDFKRKTSQEWKEKIIQDLKGKSYEDQLVWKSPEQIAVQPFYTGENLSEANSISYTNPDWDICEEFIVDDAQNSNKEILNALNGGANAILLYLNADVNLDILLKDVLLDCIQIHFVANGNPNELLKSYLVFAKKSGFDQQSLQGTIHFDVYENLIRTGNWTSSESADLMKLETLLKNCPPNIRCICIDTPIYQNAGANSIEQLAINLATVNEYVQKFGPEALEKMAFFTAVGSNYFFEIAKLRALRNLVSFLGKQYNKTLNDIWIHAENSLRNKSIFDPYVNMLRTGSEAMSGVLGGVNSFANKSFDAAYKLPDEFGNRIARNQQSLLKGESYLDKVADPAAGAYYIENLTEELSEKAFDLFKTIEAKGGLLACIQNGFIQELISKSAEKEQAAFNSSEKPLLGTNLYPNNLEKMSGEITFTNPFCTVAENTEVKAIVAKRLSEESDKERLANESKA